jgi:hypothetical protein
MIYVSHLSLFILLMVSCQPQEKVQEPISQQGKEALKRGDIPKNGVELIDLLMEKATVRASLNEDDQQKVRQIFEETFLAQHGDLNIQITPDNYLPMRKALFFGSRDSLKKYMKGDKSME